MKMRTTKDKIAERLTYLRKERGISQDQLLKDLKVSKGTVVSWERSNGKSKVPSYEQLQKLSTYYSCSISYLLCETDTRALDNVDICSSTGLSSYAVDILKDLRDFSNDVPYMTFINYLLESIVPFITTYFDAINYESMYAEALHANQAGKVIDVALKDMFFRAHIFQEVEKYRISEDLTPAETFTEWYTKEQDPNANPVTIGDSYIRMEHLLNKTKLAKFTFNEELNEILNSYFRSTIKSLSDELRE